MSRLRLFVFGLLSITCVLAGLGLRGAAAQPTDIEAGAILDHLNSAISWYRHIISVDASGGNPSDALYLQNARRQALQALQLSFQSAGEQALIQSSTPPQASSEQDSDQQNIAKATTDVASRIGQTQALIDALNERIKRSKGKKRQDLRSQRDALQGELDLEKALQEGLTKISGFMGSAENKSLSGKINTLKQSVPELAVTTAKPPEPQISKSSRIYGSGLIGKASLFLAQIGDVRTINQLLSETAKLRDTAERLQKPLRDSLTGLLKEGRDAVNQPAKAPDAGDIRQKLVAATTQFKQLSNAALPLRQEIIVLDQVRGNLLEWRKSVEREYGRVLGSLLLHVLVILVALATVMLFSEIWRRATYRYVQEVRRRRQVLLLRRFITGFLMAMVVIFGFVSEFSSLATFAGFLTAGIAVALQAVILSVAAYFFLIGRYGVRVGDRITVAGVTGDVIDIGLMRLHLLELSGTGVNLYPTGRVVVFANSVLFQSTPLFKQVPGTAYTWHEAVVALSPGGDHSLAEKRLLEALSSAYAPYGHDLERQHGTAVRTIEAEIPVPAPQGQLRFTDTGLEFVGRYPVDIRRASEIDDQVARKLIEVIESEPNLKAAVSGPLKLQSAIKN